MRLAPSTVMLQYKTALGVMISPDHVYTRGPAHFIVKSLI